MPFENKQVVSRPACRLPIAFTNQAVENKHTKQSIHTQILPKLNNKRHHPIFANSNSYSNIKKLSASTIQHHTKRSLIMSTWSAERPILKHGNTLCFFLYTKVLRTSSTTQLHIHQKYNTFISKS